MYTTTEIKQRIRARANIAFGNDFKAYLDANLDIVIDETIQRLLRESLQNIVETVINSDPIIVEKLQQATRLNQNV